MRNLSWQIISNNLSFPRQVLTYVLLHLYLELGDRWLRRECLPLLQETDLLTYEAGRKCFSFNWDGQVQKTGRDKLRCSYVQFLSWKLAKKLVQDSAQWESEAVMFNTCTKTDHYKCFTRQERNCLLFFGYHFCFARRDKLYYVSGNPDW